MKSAVEKRILVFAFVVLTLTIAVNTGFNIEGFRLDYRDGIVLRCQSLAAGLRSSLEKVLSLGIPLADMDGINARCQEIVLNDPEIAYCLVENAQGDLLYSNDPSFHSSSDAEFLSEQNQSVALIYFPHLGKVFDVTTVINGADGSLAGRIRLGFPEEVLKQLTAKVFRRSLVVLGSAFLLVFGMVIVFTKRDVVGPIGRLCRVAQEIASGNFAVDVPRMTTRDFEELGGALREMARSLKERGSKIQESYAELEMANRELQQSYEYQERISVELGHSRETYRSLLEDASDAILVTDDQDRIVMINKAAEIFFGLPRSEAVGSNMFMVLERLQSDSVEQQYEMFERIRKGETLESELGFTRLNENRRVVGWVRGSPVVGPDGKRMVQAIIRDVTRDREIKENLETIAADLKNLNQMKDSFLGMASHELKTPLTVIIGYSELILGEMGGEVEPPVMAMVRYISDAAERLSNIVRDMVDVSMLDRKQLSLRKTNVDFNQLIRTAAREMEFFFKVRNQSIRFALADVLPTIQCDPDRLIQVLSNLIGNAVKFTPDGGEITVATALVRSLRLPQQNFDNGELVLIDSKPHAYIELVIRDTGIGIDEQEQIHIFDKFYEVGKIEEHFTAKMAFKGKGTGLGLTIVKGIVDMHAGAIWVESAGSDPAACPGSAFHVMLPLLAPGEEPATEVTA